MTANQHTATVGFIGLGDQGAPYGPGHRRQRLRAARVGPSARRAWTVLRPDRRTWTTPLPSGGSRDILELCLRDDRDIWEVRTTGRWKTPCALA